MSASNSHDDSNRHSQDKSEDGSHSPSSEKLKLHFRRDQSGKEFDADKLRRPHTVTHSPALAGAGLANFPGGNAGGLLRNDRRPEVPPRDSSVDRN